MQTLQPEGTMNVFRKPMICVLLPLLFPLAACNGNEHPEPGFRQTVAVPRHLPGTDSTEWVDRLRHELPVTFASGSTKFTIDWTTVQQGSVKGISEIGVAYPPHPKNEAYSARVVGASMQRSGATSVVLLTLDVTRKRRTGSAASDEHVLVDLRGDGQSTIH
jgi:hypothetical protein